jgi:hypothetical protein
MLGLPNLGLTTSDGSRWYQLQQLCFFRDKSRRTKKKSRKYLSARIRTTRRLRPCLEHAQAMQE